MSRLSLITLLALSNLAYSTQILAEEIDQAAAGSTETTKTDKSAGNEDTLGATVVTATRSEMSAAMAPANVSVITTDNTENRLTQRIGDALKDVPGVYLRGSAYGTNFPGSSVASSSFHGVSGTNRSLYLIDGLPVNTGSNGNVDWNILNMDDAQQVEYVPGPFSALYGSGAMGGVLNVISKVPTKREGRLSFGAGGAAVDQWGIKGRYRDRFENGLGISLTFNHMDSDNWAVSDYVTVARSTTATNGASVPVLGATPTINNQGAPVYLIGDKGRRPWEQNNASLHLYYDLTPSTQIDGGMSWSRSETSDTGSYNSYLTRSNGNPLAIGVGNAGNPSNNINIDGRRYNVYEQLFLHSLPSIEDTRRYFTHLKHDFGHDVKLNIDFQYMQHETYSPFANVTSDSLSGGTGQLTVTPSNRIDGNVALRFPFLWAQRNFLTVGFGATHSELEGQSRYALGNWRNWDSITSRTAFGSGESSIYSAYLQDELWIMSNLIAHLGVRYDDWSTSGLNQSTSPAVNRSYQERSVGQFNPKFSLTWLPVDGYKLFASTGWAFRPPTNFELYGNTQTSTVLTEPNPNLEPETMHSWEVGGEATPIGGTTIAASYFHHYISDLIYAKSGIPTPGLLQTLTERQNAGKAEVEGVEVKLRQKLYWDWLHFNGTYTLNDSIITENTANPLIVGKQMVQLPETMFSGALDVKYDKWIGGIIGRYVSQPYFDDQNLDQYTNVPGSYDPYFLVDTRIAYQATKNIDLSFSVNNLLAREYSAFYQQAGRTVYGEISYSF
ncbi:TonB-dependent receptor [Methylomonas sp. 11b]|uniref:TonB-dependent receptor n=1 Tax=Methylomonas sp. 11b TaxID=1168169 RepID=UPI0004B82501|nr:TonB-dependent receptor [Methylomonas sp. 11b]